MPVTASIEPPALRCELTRQVTAGTVSLSGLVFTTDPRSGTYQLRVVKTGPSGSSVLNQGGAFATTPPEASAVGHLTFSVEVGANYTAHLRVASGEISAECEDGHERL